MGAVLWLGGAAPAGAELLDYTATLDLDISTIETFRVEASGRISVNPDGSFTFPAGVLATTRTLIPPQTPAEGLASIDFQMVNAVGFFNGPANPGGTMSLNGQAVLNLQPEFGFPPLTIGITPLGVGGTSMGTASNGSTQATATLTGTPWQTGVFQQTGVSAQGSTFAQRTNTGQDLRTSGGVGVVTLVVPAYITTRADGKFSDRGPISGLLSITFAPEPAQLLGEGAMLVVLLTLGGRRLRQRRAAVRVGSA
jgi:hypothetical protein